MKRLMGIFLSIIAFAGATFFYDIPAVSAQGVLTLGEIRSSGRTLIGSSNGGWNVAGPTYPLITHTAIRTEDGVTTVYFRDGSRVSLSKDSSATIDGAGSDYVITLDKGKMAFNINASSALRVVTPSATIEVNEAGLVQKAAFEKREGALGMIFAGKKGTEVRCISGRVNVDGGEEGVRVVSTGESAFIASSGGYKVYKAQAFDDDAPEQGNGGAESGSAALGGGGGTALIQAGMVSAFVGGGFGVYSVDRGGSGRQSASQFCPQTPCQ